MEMKPTLTPETFLESQGIFKSNTTLICHIDGCNRQPDLCSLLENFHKAKLMELDMKITPDIQSKSIRTLNASIDGYPG